MRKFADHARGQTIKGLCAQQQVPLESTRTRHRKRVRRKERDITKRTKLRRRATNAPSEIQIATELAQTLTR